MSIVQQCFLCGKTWEVGSDGPVVASEAIFNGDVIGPQPIWMHLSCFRERVELNGRYVPSHDQEQPHDPDCRCEACYRTLHPSSHDQEQPR